MLIIKKIKNNMFLTLVFIVYVLLTIFIPEKAFQSFNNSLYYMKEMLIIMPVILLLTSLIEAWVPKKTIENALGEKSGAKGILFSFLLGSFSAGPIYAAFPVCKTLLKKGANVLNIVIILSAWAVIKVPMLANESKFLGPKFMAVRWGLTTIAILIIAWISSKIVKKEEIPVKESMEKEEAVLNVNNKFCIGCGLCTKVSPNHFIMEDKKAKVNKKILKTQEDEKIRYVIDKCPAKAIEYS
ncbi:permease [Clostridium sp. ZC22-4]|uniref:Permease n=1 Tax=Clostridium brassicae TaxID=2999072 RepID=A0ABT4D828_9CLOT|nr:permease [Clostridium brassicae]